MSTFFFFGGGGGGGSISERHIMCKLEGYHENIGGYYDSYGGYHYSYGGYRQYIGNWKLFSSLGSSLTKTFILYIETSDALNNPWSTDDSPTPEL